MVLLTLAFSFAPEGKTGPAAEELVAAGLGAARQKHPRAEPGELFLTENRQQVSAHRMVQLVWLPGAGTRT